MRIATIILSILDAAVAAVIAFYMLRGESDPATMGLDVVAGWSAIVLCLVTAVPALILALKTGWRKAALALALGFPVGVVALVAAMLAYLEYM